MKTGSKITAIVLVLVALVLVNYLAARLPLRVDATAGGIYTLSPGTKALLAKIETPVTIDFYFSRDISGLPTSYKNYASRVQELLRQYVRASSGKITLNVITPQPDTPEEERAAAAGLQAQTISTTGETIYFGIVAIQADQEKNIPALTPQREAFLEYDISQLIHGVQVLDRPRLGLITSLPLAGQQPDMQMMMMQRQRPPAPQFVYTEWSRSCEIVPIEPTAQELPADLAALAIIHPQGVTEKLEYAIDQFVLSGRPVLVAVDPSSDASRRAGGQQAMMMGMPPQNLSSDLPRLLKAWGVTYNPGEVVGDLKLATPINTGRSVERYPIWLSLAAENLNRDAQPTAQLNTLLFVEPGALAVDTAQTGLAATPLIETSDQAGNLSADSLMMPDPASIARQITPAGKKLLALQLTGKFKTAFPDGAPKAASAENDGDKPAEENKPAGDEAKPGDAAKPAAPALKEGASTVIVIADTDWLLDDFGIRRFNFLGSEAVEPLNDNLSFASNLADIITGSTDLVTLRGKANTERPFTVVRDMQADAQQKYQAKLGELETRLTEVQTKLGELMGKTSEGNRLVATPEMQKTIEDFQKQEIEMRRERREIRRSLREDIDALEYKLAALNLFSMPAIILLGAFLFHRSRRR
ncbi:GldG family protein [Termitidicoccus mucosus]|uniref:ABC transporter n=1 Tax=Termitidicoccus mucosus TaxID=1184151 RepID=A0A178IGV1_9BACT|nr:ABC transporter [Opitutaceae bacterium TSB47]